MTIKPYGFERLPEKWPLHGSYGASLNAVLFVVGLVLGAYVLFFASDQDPTLLQRATGCFINHQHRIAIIVDRHSTLRAEGLTIPVTVHRLKWGGARLLPNRRVEYDPGTNRLETTAKDPLFIDSDRFFETFTVLAADDASAVVFARVPCPFPSGAAAR